MTPEVRKCVGMRIAELKRELADCREGKNDYEDNAHPGFWTYFDNMERGIYKELEVLEKELRKDQKCQ